MPLNIPNNKQRPQTPAVKSKKYFIPQPIRAEYDRVAISMIAANAGINLNGWPSSTLIAIKIMWVDTRIAITK
jgi:hypothetical protein